MLLHLPEELFCKILRYVVDAEEGGEFKNVATLATVHSTFQRAMLSSCFWTGRLLSGAEVLLDRPNLYRRALTENCTELREDQTEERQGIVLQHHFPRLQLLEVGDHVACMHPSAVLREV